MQATEREEVSSVVPAPTRVDAGCPVKWDDIEPCYHWLAGRGWGWQFGEQGIIQTILTTIGLDSGKVFECGAGDGTRLPLMAENLILEGWKSLLVEPNSAAMDRTRAKLGQLGIKNATFCEDVLCVRDNLAEGGVLLDELFRREHFHPDVLILDIDSFEWYVIDEMDERPKVIVVEHHDINDPEAPLNVPELSECGKTILPPDHPRAFRKQTPWFRMRMLLMDKGYVPVAKTRVNGIYVRKDLAPMVAEGPRKRRWAKVEDPRCTIVLSQPRIGFTDHALKVADTCRVLGYPVIRGAGVFWDRDMSLATERAIADHKPDFLIYSDYDSVFEADDVRKLVEAINNDPEMGAIGCVQMSRHDDRPLVYDCATDYSQEICEVKFQHFGLTVVRRQVFETMPQPWFWSQPTLDGSWGAPNRSDADILFWRCMHEHQIKVCQHNGVVIGHLVLCAKFPTNKGKGVRLLPMEMYNVHGKPKDAVFTPDLYKPRADAGG